MSSPVRGPEVITSAANDRVAAARRLRHRKGRRQAGALLAEGPHALSAALGAGARVREVFATAELGDAEPALLAAAGGAGGTVRLVTPAVLRTLCDTVTPQGVVGVVDLPAARLDDVLAGSPRLVCLLPEISDPGNAGTVIRTADAAGAAAVVLGAGSVDVWSGKAVRASAGSLFHLPVVTGEDPPDVVRRLHAAGLSVLAATADGEDDLDELADTGQLVAPTAWLFGHEAHGIDPDLAGRADRRVRIRIRGGAESLNLAAAAAVCLFASARAQRA